MDRGISRRAIKGLIKTFDKLMHNLGKLAATRQNFLGCRTGYVN